MSWQKKRGATSAGGSSAQAAKLQSLPSGTLAAWALETDPVVRNIPGDDRAPGFALPLSAVNAFNAPDIIPGSRAFQTGMVENPYVLATVLPDGISRNGPAASLRLQGEMTAMGRIAATSYPQTPAAFQWLVAFGDFLTPSEDGNVQYSLVLGGAGSTLQYFAQFGPGSSAIQVDTGLVVNDGLWHFVALRRTAGGVVTVSVDGQTFTSGALALPTGGIAGRINIGRAPSTPGAGANIPFIGFMKDWLIMNRRATDAEVLSARREALGPYFIP